jgi:threonine dehydratase
VTPLLTPADVCAARDRLTAVGGLVERTPLVPSRDPGLWLKLENRQRSGAFKARGASSALTALTPAQRARGIVTHSSGNHGRALAEAGRALGCEVTVVVPDTAPAHKVEAVLAAGAHVVVVPAAEREQRAAALAAQGAVLVPPFDHDDVIAGQGTVGLEVAEQAREEGLRLGLVVAPVGGGGLVSGIAVALAGTGVEVVAAEPALAGDLAESLRRGRRVRWPVERTSRTVADGLRLPSVGVRPWQHIRALGVRAVTVSEPQIVAAQAWLAAAGVVAEPSGAVSVAAARAMSRSVYAGAAVVAVVSGGNVDPDAPPPTLDVDDPWE